MKGRFDKFGHYLNVETLRTCLTHKKSILQGTANKNDQDLVLFHEAPKVSSLINMEAQITPELASNVPGLPYRLPSAFPTQLKLAQI
jgi:hypothetical protein